MGGGDRVGWLTTYLGVKDSLYVRDVGRLLLDLGVIYRPRGSTYVDRG